MIHRGTCLGKKISIGTGKRDRIQSLRKNKIRKIRED